MKRRRPHREICTTVKPTINWSLAFGSIPYFSLCCSKALYCILLEFPDAQLVQRTSRTRLALDGKQDVAARAHAGAVVGRVQAHHVHEAAPCASRLWCSESGGALPEVWLRAHRFVTELLFENPLVSRGRTRFLQSRQVHNEFQRLGPIWGELWRGRKRESGQMRFEWAGTTRVWLGDRVWCGVHRLVSVWRSWGGREDRKENDGRVESVRWRKKSHRWWG